MLPFQSASRSRIDVKVSAFLRTRSDLITIGGRLVRNAQECDSGANECIEFGEPGLARVRELPRDHLICVGPGHKPELQYTVPGLYYGFTAAGYSFTVRARELRSRPWGSPSPLLFPGRTRTQFPVLPAHEQRPHNCPDLPLPGPGASPHTADSLSSYHRLSIISAQSF